MTRRVCAAVAVGVLMCAGAFAQEKREYLDVEVARVKPEKRAEFDAVCKKMAVANRKHQGDNWFAMESAYGETNLVVFVSPRPAFADVEKGMNAFLGALEKANGPAGAAKLEQDFNNTVIGARNEIRIRRYDLSANAPKDAAGQAALLGQTRWIRTTAVHVRAGHAARFEEQVKELKEAIEKDGTSWTFLASQAVAGQHGMVYYVSTLVPSFAAFDALPSIQKLLGEDGFRRFQEASAEAVESTDSNIYRILPELSNPPDAVAAVAPDFWRPKPVASPAAAKTTKPEEKK